MLDIMYEVPTKNNIKKFVVTREMIREKNIKFIKSEEKGGSQL